MPVLTPTRTWTAQVSAGAKSLTARDSAIRTASSVCTSCGGARRRPPCPSAYMDLRHHFAPGHPILWLLMRVAVHAYKIKYAVTTWPSHVVVVQHLVCDQMIQSQGLLRIASSRVVLAIKTSHKTGDGGSGAPQRSSRDRSHEHRTDRSTHHCLLWDAMLGSR